MGGVNRRAPQKLQPRCNGVYVPSSATAKARRPGSDFGSTSGRSLTDGTKREDRSGDRHLPCDVTIPLENSRIQPDRSALGQRIGRRIP